jgi:hypothetical protein
MNNNKKYLLIIVFLIIALIASLFVALRATVFTNKAATTNQSSAVALENSYLFVSPLQAKADGQEKIRITVFVLDGRGLGVSGQKIKLSVSPKIIVSEVQNTTDSSGKAIFDLSSTFANKYDVSATTQTGTIPQQVKVAFY